MDHTDSTSGLETQLHHFMGMGQWQRALETIQTLLANQPESAWNHYCAGQIHYHLNNNTAAEKHFKKCIAEQPDMAAAYEFLAQVYLSMGRAGTADDYVKKSLELDPTSDHAWFLHAHLCLHHENYSAAIESAERSISLNPENVSAKEVIIRTRREMHTQGSINSKEAIEEQEKLLSEEPENDYLHYGMGNLYYETKNYSKAEEFFRKAIQLDPEDKDYHQCLIRTLRKRDLVLRLLWLPYLPISLILKFCKLLSNVFEKKLSFSSVLLIILCIPLLLLVKYLIIIGLVTAVFFFTIFWPVCKVYEYLTIADIHKKMGLLKLYKGPMAKLHKLSFPARFGIFVLCMLVFWGSISTLIFSPYAPALLAGITSIAGILFLALVVIGFIISFREGRQKKKTDQFFNQNS